MGTWVNLLMRDILGCIYADVHDARQGVPIRRIILSLDNGGNFMYMKITQIGACSQMVFHAEI